MKKYTLNLLLGLVVVLLTNVQLNAQITAQQAVVEMGRGINMGNTFDARDYEGGEWAPAAKEVYFEMYKDAGFKTVRIPITWDAGISADNENSRLAKTAPYAIDSSFMARIDTVISWSLERGMYTIINAHHDSWIKKASTFDAEKPRFYSLWEQLAERYKDYSDKLIFEMINEPHHDDGSLTTEQVNELNAEVLSIIRANNPTRIVLYSGQGWSNSPDLLDAAIPDSSDQYLMGYYHSYNPWDFAGEGNGTWGTEADIKAMEDQMISVETWSDENNVPVLIGEFGARVECDYNSRMLYYANYAKLALQHNLAFCVWDDDGWFQVLEREEEKWSEVKDVLIYSTDSTNTNIVVDAVEDTAIEVSWVSKGNPELIKSVLVEKRTMNTEFTSIVELGVASGTIYIDRNAVAGEYAYYRVVDVYENDTIPSYPQSYMLIGSDREPFDGVIVIPGTIEAENFDVGGELLTYHDTEPENKGGAYRLEESVDIESRDDGFQVGYVEEGEWLEYTVDVEKDGEYKITALLASKDGGGEMRLRFGNTYAPTITAPNTNSWTELGEVSVVVRLKEGEQVMRLSIETVPAFNIDKLIFEEYDGVGIIEQDVKLVVYPNPAKDNLNIQIEGQIINEVLIYATNGMLVDKLLVDNTVCRLGVKNYKSGIYYIIAKTNEGSYKTTFMK